ncbi:MAG: hypothetical protein F6K04_02475 [Leptolyngbya sp. SIO4C5]|nr:hypothetical protein [Leptolyngbya sp. SIO4C5]
MRKLLTAIATLAIVPFTIIQTAQSIEPSFLCYMIHLEGEVVNLSDLCGIQELQALELDNSSEDSTNTSPLSGLRLHSDGSYGDENGVAYEVWQKEDRSGYYLFLWPGNAASRSSLDPQVVAYYPGAVVMVNEGRARGCYARNCPEPGILYSGNCLFPWQTAADGSRCGARAATIRAGGEF